MNINIFMCLRTKIGLYSTLLIQYAHLKYFINFWLSSRVSQFCVSCHFTIETFFAKPPIALETFRLLKIFDMLHKNLGYTSRTPNFNVYQFSDQIYSISLKVLTLDILKVYRAYHKNLVNRLIQLITNLKSSRRLII